MNEKNYKNKPQSYNFATWLRVFSTISILLCHFVAQSNNSYLRMTSQFFNIGVELFFILSGFLFGTKLNAEEIATKDWYKKRLKRIYVPYEMFLVFLALVYIILGKNILTIDWLLLTVGAQGTVVGVWGAEQTWFISSLLLCYLVTPVIAKLYIWLVKYRKWQAGIMVIICLVPFLLALIPQEFVLTLFAPIAWYSLAYWLGLHFNQIKKDRKYALAMFIIMCLMFFIRIYARNLLDGTIWYDRITVRYTQAVAAFCIFYIFAYIFEKYSPGKVVSFISAISFEIYLYHYMFCVGPVRLFGLTSYWIIDCFTVVVVTIMIAFIMNRLQLLAGNRIKEIKNICRK